jgi:hypothetical protein
MKRTNEQATQHDPWNDLVQSSGLTPVPLEQVLQQLRVSQPEANAVKKGLLTKLNRICDDKKQ